MTRQAKCKITKIGVNSQPWWEVTPPMTGRRAPFVSRRWACDSTSCNASRSLIESTNWLPSRECWEKVHTMSFLREETKFKERMHCLYQTWHTTTNRRSKKGKTSYSTRYRVSENRKTVSKRCYSLTPIISKSLIVCHLWIRMGRRRDCRLRKIKCRFRKTEKERGHRPLMKANLKFHTCCRWRLMTRTSIYIKFLRRIQHLYLNTSYQII